MYTHRTLFRHLAVATALSLLPFSIAGRAAVLAGLERYAILYISLLLLSVGWAVLARLLTRNLRLTRSWLRGVAHLKRDRWVLRGLKRPAALSSAGLRAITHWTRCGRCVAYWSAAVSALVLVWWGLPAGEQPWANWMARGYYAILSGSVAAFLIVAAELVREFRIQNKER
ncbi:MAG: hypothetical protein H7A21_12485 [Spirochaetales bacterium]|nr:hypothetical protein [Leptospiraceae bacterium]MCP5482246.1 hypothetical protein [Spirochaetales bacterium]MCP5484642.1 hypothetical protein [Spirochaetales bacterium]